MTPSDLYPVRSSVKTHNASFLGTTGPNHTTCDSSPHPPVPTVPVAWQDSDPTSGPPAAPEQEGPHIVKFRVDRAVFADAVAWAARSLPVRPSTPVLSGLLIEA